MPLEKRQKTIYNSQTGTNENVEEVFEVAGSNEASYDQGQPKKDHYLYFDSGDLVFQAEMAIFRVHSFFLTQHSKVLSDMFEVASNDKEEKDGTIDSPLVLQDKARGWELVLSSFYRREPLVAFEYSGKDLLSVLEIAHKYCMDGFEERILAKLNTANTTQEFVDMVLAARIVESYTLHQKAVEGLVRVAPKPNLEQARMIGIDTYHEIASRCGVR